MTTTDSELTIKAREVARCLTYNDDKPQAEAKHLLLEMAHRIDAKDIRIHKKRDGLLLVNGLAAGDLPMVGDLAMLVARLARKLRKAAPADELPAQALDYLNRNGLNGSPLRKVGAGETATVTREMIGAAHDVTLAKGDFVLSAALLERIYLAMEQAAPPPQTPFDTCPTCEALARTVMMDQTGAA